MPAGSSINQSENNVFVGGSLAVGLGLCSDRDTDGVPTCPIHYASHIGHFWLGLPSLFSAPCHRPSVWSQGLTGQRI